jgi:hypothetical protein
VTGVGLTGSGEPGRCIAEAAPKLPLTLGILAGTVIVAALECRANSRTEGAKVAAPKTTLAAIAAAEMK